MKLNKLVFPLVFALAVAVAATGCKKGYSKVTPIPGSAQPIVGDNNGGNTLPAGGTMDNTGGGAGSGVIGQNGAPGQIATTSEWDPANFDQDRTALAAYTVHFAFDSATVKDNEQAKISSVAQALQADANAKLLIEGNCDERGTEEYNRALGERRALALREILVKDGIDANRIRTISYGKDKPVDPGHDESAWSKNRRGDFVLCHPKAGV